MHNNQQKQGVAKMSDFINNEAFSKFRDSLEQKQAPKPTLVPRSEVTGVVPTNELQQPRVVERKPSTMVMLPPTHINMLIEKVGKIADVSEMLGLQRPILASILRDAEERGGVRASYELLAKMIYERDFGPKPEPVVVEKIIEKEVAPPVKFTVMARVTPEQMVQLNAILPSLGIDAIVVPLE